MLRFHSIILMLCTLTLVNARQSHASQVLSVNDLAEEVDVSLDSGSHWAKGDYVCIQHAKNVSALGPIIEISPNSAKVHLEKVMGPVEAGDLVQAVPAEATANLQKNPSKPEDQKAEEVKGDDGADQIQSDEEQLDTGTRVESGTDTSPPSNEGDKKPAVINEREEEEAQEKAVDKSTSRNEILNYHKNLIQSREDAMQTDGGKNKTQYDLVAGIQMVDLPTNWKIGVAAKLSVSISEHWTAGLEGVYGLPDSASGYDYFIGFATAQYYFNTPGSGIHLLFGIGGGDIMPSSGPGAANYPCFNAEAAIGGQWYVSGSIHLGVELGAQIFLMQLSLSTPGSAPATNSTYTSFAPYAAVNVGVVFQ